jgi:phage tail sheath protein FI
MPETVAPGVYVEETGAGAHVIAGVPTSTAAFVGGTEAGPVAAPLIVRSFAEFEAQFGGV